MNNPIQSKGVLLCIIHNPVHATVVSHEVAGECYIYLAELRSGEWAVCDASEIDVYTTWLFKPGEKAPARAYYQERIDRWQR